MNFDFQFTLLQPECATRQTNRKSKFIVKVHCELADASVQYQVGYRPVAYADEDTVVW